MQDLPPNNLAKLVIPHEAAYNDLVIELRKAFPTAEQHESRFGITEVDRPDTATVRPKRYPCIMVALWEVDEIEDEGELCTQTLSFTFMFIEQDDFNL